MAAFDVPKTQFEHHAMQTIHFKIAILALGVFKISKKSPPGPWCAILTSIPDLGGSAFLSSLSTPLRGESAKHMFTNDLQLVLFVLLFYVVRTQ